VTSLEMLPNGHRSQKAVWIYLLQRARVQRKRAMMVHQERMSGGK
jgi:hypothetical protein